jgi:shikimate kinase
MNIVLIGYRASGKTEVGKRLASRLHMDFVDTDDLIQARQGRSIKGIVETLGWDHFRTLEKEVVSTISERDEQVIAAGGGVVLDRDNVLALRKKGWMIWLKADAETLMNRMEKDPRTLLQRPSLTGKGTLDELGEVLTVRNSFYEEAAETELDTSRSDVEGVIGQILSVVKEKRRKL